MKELRVYLSSVSVPVIPQMIDFAKCANDKNVVKVIGWYRNEISDQKLKGTQAKYYRQISRISPEFVTYILKLVGEFKPDKISLHVNIYWCLVELFPLVSYLARLVPRDKIHLHVYDDGSAGVVERNAMHQLSEVDFLHQKRNCVEKLMGLLRENVRPFDHGDRSQWPAMMNYTWHEFFNTTYHLINEFELRCHVNSPLFNYVSSNMVSLNNNNFYTLTKPQQAFCLSLLNVDTSLLLEVAAKIMRPNSLLYFGSGRFGKSEDDELTEQQIIKIRALKSQGVIKNNDQIIFKAHPINHKENREKIKDELGPNTYMIPNALPFEALQLAGIPLCEIISTFTTLIYTLPKAQFRHVIGDGDTRSEVLNKPVIQQLIENNQLSENNISGWLD
ncbi:hypothetical protein ACIPMZ_10510 [Scandinavium goeteborgense]|uniref:hypothetical protein n=1 Tax=Scandinavium goeteborgense TaxID=1851514 RepID=UPI0037F81F26